MKLRTDLGATSRAATSRISRIAIQALVGALLFSGDVAAQIARALALDEARFSALHAQLCQAPQETWESVPWRIDLLAAQHEAASAKKPLFVWAMDGHPLACT